jgi:hypothetical protein
LTDFDFFFNRVCELVPFTGHFVQFSTGKVLNQEVNADDSTYYQSAFQSAVSAHVKLDTRPANDDGK